MAEIIRKGQLFLKETLEEIVEGERWDELETVLREHFLQDVAHLMKYFPLEKNVLMLKHLGAQRAEILLRETDRVTRGQLTAELDDEFLSDVLEAMDSDEAADIFGGLPEEQAERILKLVAPDRARQMRELLQYPPDTAGGVMTHSFIAVNEKLSLDEATALVREKAKGTLAPRIYVVDENNVLKGYVPSARLLGCNLSSTVSDVMLSRVVKVTADTDQEEVARIFTKYDLFTMPVVDSEDRLVGVITVDDVVEIIHDEASEDALKLSGTQVEEIGQKSALKIARTRLPWLVVSWIEGILASLVIGHFTGELEKALILSAFIPVILGMGGNAGMQAATVVVRGLATGDITRRDILNVIFREFRVGVVLGLTFGLLLGSVTHIRYFHAYDRLGFVVGSAILTQMTLGVCIGTFLPIFFRKLGTDPAVASGPFVTASLDITGILIYFSLAKVIMPL